MLNWPIIGLRFGESIIQELLQPVNKAMFTIVGACDLDQKKVDHCAKTYGLACFTDVELLIKNCDFDVAGIYTPPGTHLELIERFIDLGKDIVTTKPFSFAENASRVTLKKIEERGRILCMNSPSPEKTWLQRVIADVANRFELGKPVACRADGWVNYHEQADGSWYDDPKACPLAPIFRLGIYRISEIIPLFGTVSQGSAFSSRIMTNRPTTDNAQLSLLFDNGAIANIFISFCVDDSQRYKGSCVVNYQNGTFYFGNQVKANDTELDTITFVTKQNGQRQIEIFEGKNNVGVYPWALFAQSVLAHKASWDVPAYHNEIIQGVRICERLADLEKNQGTIL